MALPMPSEDAVAVSTRGVTRPAHALRLLLATALFLTPAASARADTLEVSEKPTAVATTGTPTEQPASPGGDGRRTVGRLPVSLGLGAVGVFHADNLKPFAVGLAVAAPASTWDQDVHASAGNPDSGFGKALDTAGGWPTSVLVAGLFTAGRFSADRRFRAMSYDLVDATIVNFGYTELLKVTVQRTRPDGSNNASFPSGHTSNAVALATVAERHYGWKVGVPAYAVAAAIGWSRIVYDKHYLSDVLAGATLGYIVGRTVVRVNGGPVRGAARGAVLRVSPAIGRRDRGMQVVLSF